MKKKPIFAMTYIRTGETKLRLSIGFFCVLLITLSGFTPPCGALMSPLPVRCKSTGKVEPLLYFTIHKTIVKIMTNPNNNCKVSAISRPSSTDDARNALTLLFQSHYPGFLFTFFDSKKSFGVKVVSSIEGWDYNFTFHSKTLALLTVKTNNHLVERCATNDSIIRVDKGNVLHALEKMADVTTLLSDLILINKR